MACIANVSNPSSDLLLVFFALREHLTFALTTLSVPFTLLQPVGHPCGKACGNPVCALLMVRANNERSESVLACASCEMAHRHLFCDLKPELTLRWRQVLIVCAHRQNPERSVAPKLTKQPDQHIRVVRCEIRDDSTKVVASSQRRRGWQQSRRGRFLIHGLSTSCCAAPQCKLRPPGRLADIRLP